MKKVFVFLSALLCLAISLVAGSLALYQKTIPVDEVTVTAKTFYFTAANTTQNFQDPVLIAPTETVWYQFEITNQNENQTTVSEVPMDVTLTFNIGLGDNCTSTIPYLKVYVYDEDDMALGEVELTNGIGSLEVDTYLPKTTATSKTFKVEIVWPSHDDDINYAGHSNGNQLTIKATATQCLHAADDASHTPATYYLVKGPVLGVSGGSVSFSKILASSGDTITVTYTPDTGYGLSSASIKNNSNNNDVTLTGTGDTKTFVMPASHVTYAATFKNIFDLEVTLTGSNPESVTTTQHFAGDQVVISATPKTDYGFDAIYLDSVEILEGITIDANDGSIEYTLTMPNKDCEIEVVFVDFAGGAGTQADPYRLYAANQLEDLATRISPANTDSTSRDAFRTAYYKQEQDIDGEGTTSMYPIGTKTVYSVHYSFAGNYDGQGHSVDGITVSKYGNSNLNLGLFGYTEGATIKNLTIGANMVIGDGTGSQVGGLVGNASDATIIDSVINNAPITGELRAGGIAGRSSSSVVFTNVANTAAITVTVRQAGGIVGNLIDSTIYNAYNTGTITANKKAGGIVGNINSSAIYIVYNLGTTSGTPHDPIAGKHGDIDNTNVFYALSSDGAESGGFNPTIGNNTAIDYLNAGVTAYRANQATLKDWGGTASAPVFVD